MHVHMQHLSTGILCTVFSYIQLQFMEHVHSYALQDIVPQSEHMSRFYIF